MDSGFVTQPQARRPARRSAPSSSKRSARAATTSRPCRPRAPATHSAPAARGFPRRTPGRHSWRPGVVVRFGARATRPGRLPDLSALLPGLRRRRRGRPARGARAPRPPRRPRRGRALAVADLPVADGRLRLRRLRLHRRRPRLRLPRRLRRARGRGARARPGRAARHRPLPHVDRAPLVPRAPRLVHLGRRAEQLALGVRRLGLVAARRALLPPLVLPRAAGPRLAQPRGRGRHAGRVPLLARARRGRLPHRRDRPAAEGPAAARRPAGRPSRSGCRCARTRRSSRSRTRATPPTWGRRSPRSAPRRATPSSWARSTCRRALGALPRALRRRVRVRAAPGPLGGRAAAGRDRGEHAHARRGVGDVQPRLRAPRHALRRARTRARPRCCC